MHVACRSNLHVTQDVAASYVGENCVLCAEGLDNERIVLTTRNCIELFRMNHFHDATELMNFPADEIMQNLGRFLIVFLLALPLDFEIIERCGMAVGVLAVSAIIAKFIP